ncbi:MULTISPECIES: DUF2285 domain-containing protein [Pacificimonas]|uniref:DUF2285 domain-containing protein n=1 Tax=Pacificimonas TaxID=1960290 RepID=UPI001CC997F7|nr:MULTISPECIES: DUF2285 domain-containing protein [Pacificimonas]
MLADDAPEFLPPSSSLAAPADVRPSPEGLHAIHRGGIVAQILLLSGRKTDRTSAVILPLDDDLPDRVEAVLRLWQALNARPVTRDGRITPYQRRRIRLMMRAADGRANGATYRQIAIALFGPERVAAEPWKTSPLRDAVIGLIESAGPFINGGYRKLLRHRRRS